jgi:hypothetical protein
MTRTFSTHTPAALAAVALASILMASPAVAQSNLQINSMMNNNAAQGIHVGTGNFSELIGKLTRISGNEVANIALSDAIPLRCESSPYGIFGKDTPRSVCHG